MPTLVRPRNVRFSTIGPVALVSMLLVSLCYLTLNDRLLNLNPLPLKIDRSYDRPPHIPGERDTVILYAYHESPNARANLLFFLQHGLHDAADFVFIFQGPTDMTRHKAFRESRGNIRYVQRPNTCFDLGAFGEVLRMDNGAIVKKYQRFIMMNSSIRGPFVPVWSKDCWSDIYTRRITDHTKLVGMTYNCNPRFGRHLQSMIMATDRIGLGVMLREIYNQCYDLMVYACAAEVKTTGVMHSAGYGVEAIFTPYHAYQNYNDTCIHDDVNNEGAHFGNNIHPFETVFFKANRGFNEKEFETFTDWYDAMDYSSYNVCHFPKTS